MLKSVSLVLFVAALHLGSAYKGLISYKPPPYGHKASRSRPIPPEVIRKAVAYAADYEHKVFGDDKGLGRDEDHPSYWGNGIAQENYTDPIPQDYGNAGFFLSRVTKYLVKELGYNPASFYDGKSLQFMNYLDYLPRKYANVCRSYYQKCYVSKYRTIDGSCNNLKFPYYGQSNTILGRIIPPKFSDGVFSIRKAKDGSPLPPPRTIRYYALPDKDVADHRINMLFVNFGQFIAHDLVHTPFYQAEDGLFLDCCHGYKGGSEQVHPKCLAIPIKNDPFYKTKTNEQCLNFARSIIAPNYGCAIGYTNAINTQTSHLDLSLQYGRTLEESKGLRVGKGGLLLTSKVGHEEYLPIDPHAECFNSSMKFCFKSGDIRTTMHPGLTLFQILSTRLHNIFAKKLKAINPYWDDEKLFQEARRINIAINQHIVYNEYLPILLGHHSATKHGLKSTSHGYTKDYDERAKPWIYAEFSGSAFRHHTLVYGEILLANQDYKVEETIPLEEYYNSAILYKKPWNLKRLLRGYILAPQRKHDKYYDPAISDLLFKDKRPFGLDIGSFNIQRGRDFGLGSYNDYRSICGLPRAKSFKDFLDHIDPETVKDFERIYRHPDDVDLYAGGIAERPAAGGILGPTHQCIVAFQFHRLRISDRHFYTLSHQPHSFTYPQLCEIRKMTLSAFLCMTTDLTYVPLHSFLALSPKNPLISCEDYKKISRMSLKPWEARNQRYEY